MTGFHTYKGYMASCATPVRYITCVADTCVIHMFYTCNTCVVHTPVLHKYFYTCSTCVGYTLVLHV